MRDENWKPEPVRWRADFRVGGMSARMTRLSVLLALSGRRANVATS